MDMNSTIKLNNGVEIPVIGLGVFRSEAGEETELAVQYALEAGYKMIDPATAYNNEESVAKGIKRAGARREDIFITTKLSRGAQRDGRELEEFAESLKKLDTDYIDLYLIHWPIEDKKYVRAWKLLERLYADGSVRAIGVSNFHKQHLDELAKVSDIVPAVNQIELHPLMNQSELRTLCAQRSIIVQAWSPLGGKGTTIIDDNRIIGIGKKYGKSPAQVILRWDVQLGINVFPKSTHRERVIENADIFDFELSQEDMSVINCMDINGRIGPDPDEPAY